MMKAITVNKGCLALVLICLLLSGCGLTQTISDGTVAMTKSLFYKQIKTLHLDIRARDAVNNNAQGNALSTIVRIYQLKDSKAFSNTDYASLFAADSNVLNADLVAQKDIRVRPGEAISVDMPMEKSAKFVAITAMFLTPDQEKNSWRVVLSREDLDPDEARHLELNAQTLTLLPAKE